MDKFRPFLINTNMCLSEDDISSFDNFMDSCAGNIGNMYISFSLLKQLGIKINNCGYINNIYKFDFKSINTFIGDKDQYTHTILILQDQIRVNESYSLKLNYDGIIKIIDYINKPLIVIGLGANSLDGYVQDFYKLLNKDLILFLRELSVRCDEIGIRGEYTQEVLADIGVNNTCVIGCPTFYETGKNRIVYKKDINEIGDILFSSSFGPDIDVIRRKNCHEIVQDKLGEKFIKLVAFDELINTNYSDSQISKYINRQYYTFSNIFDWKKFISMHKVVIGHRLHGAIISINAGVPAICCNPDSRSREMCEFLGIPYYPKMTWENFDDFLEKYDSVKFENMNSLYPKRYKNYCDYLYRNIGITKEQVCSNINELSTYDYQPHLILYKKHEKMKERIFSGNQFLE